MKLSYDLLHFESNSLSIDYFLVPWDSSIFGVPAAEIKRIELRNAEAAKEDFKHFESWLEKNEVRFAACRLEHERLRESTFLEEWGFRFVAMVLSDAARRYRFDRVA